jgi:hypothetical protein
MHRLKDIAARMDNCHERTAKRWWKKLGVPPDVIGHGPHRWEDATADRLIALWKQYYNTRGTTPQIVKAKYRGELTDTNQFDLLTWKHNENNARKRIHGSGNPAAGLGTGKTLPRLSARQKQKRR